MKKIIDIDQSFAVTAFFEDGDEKWFVKNMNDEELYYNTLTIPKPYTIDDAKSFMLHCNNMHNKHGKPMDMKIRDSANEIVGGIGIQGKYPGQPHRDEIGYWLKKELRGKGIMTRVLYKTTQYLFENYALKRIEAPIYLHNIASQKVAQKCGYIYEGTLKKAYFKDGKYFDGVLYSKTI